MRTAGIRPWLLLISLPLALWGRLGAQADSVRLNNNFNFMDGLYFDHAAWRANQPDLAWEDVDAQLVVNETTFQARLGNVRKKNDRQVVPTASIWGFSKNGVPYLRVEDAGEEDAAILRFAGLQYTGRISYFGYPDDSTRMVTITAYNPLTGRPFREGKVPRTETFFREFILHTDSGDIAPLSWTNLRAWIRNDLPLLQQASRLDEDELDLIRVLQTYDTRNPYFLHPGR